MATNKTFLPDKDSPKAQELIQLFPYASNEELRMWAKQYGYANITSFKEAMRKRWDVKRATPNSGWEPSEINHPLELDTAKERKTFAIINDTQNPYQDAESMGLMERFLQDIEFHYLIYNGDIADFYQISKFDKNPKKTADLQADLDNTRAMLYHHKKLFPDAKGKWLDGNHEDRWRKFLWTKAPEASGLRCLTIPKLFHLDDYAIDYIPYEQGLMVNGVFLILHGTIASVHSGYTAKRMYEKHGGCGVSGHSHRGGVFYKRDRFGTWGWWENFCLCHLNPDYVKNPNWVQGFSLVHFQGHRFNVEQIPILDHTLMYGGKVYK